MDHKKAFKNNSSVIKWCGYEWSCNMEGGRLIHADLPWYWMDKDNVKIFTDDDYCRVIELSLEHKDNTVKHWNGNTYHPTEACGTIRTINGFSYGTFSADIKLPHGYNLWPSFWLSGEANWPPEIDIMEAWSYNDNCFVLTQPQFPWFNPGWKTTNNIHYLKDNMEKTHAGSNNISIFKQWKNPMDNFVNYKVDWFPDSITFYVNDKVVRRIGKEIANDLTQNINKPEKGFKMNVIFNVWCENPEKFDVECTTPMQIKNFKYKPYIN